MAANADDLRFFYGAHHGDSFLLTVGTSPNNIALAPGRYRVRYRSVSGAAVLWARQCTADFEAGAAAPSAPYDVSTNGELFQTHVRGAESRLSFRTDAGTVQVVITKISK
jgi:hypothetical protein